MAAASNSPNPSAQSLRALDWLNFFLADVQTGVGPFVATFLATRGWQQQNIGWSLTVSGLVGVICQAPAGALVDWSRRKRTLVAIAILIIAAGALALAWWPNFWPVMLSQMSHGAVGSVVGPTVAAVSLGLVGYKNFGERNGRNKRFDAAGNIGAALLMGWIGWQFSVEAIFYATAILALPALIALRFIRPNEIDYARARGASESADGKTARTVKKEGMFAIFRDRRLLLFAGCAVMFHFANAAMLPLFGEMLARGHAARKAPALLSACMHHHDTGDHDVVCYFCGPARERLGPKPLLLVGWGVLPLRGLLYTLTDNPVLLIAIQILDGIGAVVFGVVSVLVIADLTRGTGRFNLAQSVIAAAVGVGASLSNAVTSWVVQNFGFNAGFLFLAGVAAVATALLWFFMPETQNLEERTAT